MGPRAFAAALVIATVLVATRVHPVPAEGGSPLTNDAILQLLRWNATPLEIVAAIQRNAGNTQFTLSAGAIDTLTKAGATPEVLRAMFESMATPARPASSPSPSETPPPPLTPHSPARLANARQHPPHAQLHPSPPPPCHSVGGKQPRTLHGDWDTGSSWPSVVDHSGATCFEIANANTALYGFSSTLSDSPPPDVSGADALSQAIGAIASVLDSIPKPTAGPSPSPSPAASPPVHGVHGPLPPPPLPPAPICPPVLGANVEAAQRGAKRVPGELKGLFPPETDSGPRYVPLSETAMQWRTVHSTFGSFEHSVNGVVDALNTPATAGEDVAACSDDVLASAEAIVLDVYPAIRDAYEPLATQVETAIATPTVRIGADLDSTHSYVLTVKASYKGVDAKGGTRTFQFGAGRVVLTPSVGFLTTWLPAPSYSSVTAPSGDDNSSTKNVLGIDYGRGPRPVVAALVNLYVPGMDGRHFGAAVSTGLVFDLSAGEADASRFGLFAGLTLHLWRQLFVTPGIHVGEFADFPQGFTAAGQTLPPNSGTPEGRKRYTARFALGMTYRIGAAPSTPPASPRPSPTPSAPASPSPAPSPSPSGSA